MTVENILANPEFGKSASDFTLVSFKITGLCFVIWLIYFTISLAISKDDIGSNVLGSLLLSLFTMMFMGFFYVVCPAFYQTQTTPVSTTVYRVESVSTNSSESTDKSTIKIRDTKTKQDYEIETDAKNFVIGQRVRLEANVINDSLHLNHTIVEYTFIKVDNINGDKQSTD